MKLSCEGTGICVAKVNFLNALVCPTPVVTNSNTLHDNYYTHTAAPAKVKVQWHVVDAEGNKIIQPHPSSHWTQLEHSHKTSCLL